MNERLRYTDLTKPINTTPPKVDVCMIQIRPDSHQWVIDALDSVDKQSYSNLGLLVVDNQERHLTIGQAWNAMVQGSDADLLLFLGDDDAITPDFIGCMVDAWTYMVQAVPNIVRITSNCTLLNDATRTMVPANIQHTGMFLRQFLLDHPFDDALERNVGAAKVVAIDTAQRYLGQPMSSAVAHHYGYIYRQHPYMVNGNPIQFNGRS